MKTSLYRHIKLQPSPRESQPSTDLTLPVTSSSMERLTASGKAVAGSTKSKKSTKKLPNLKTQKNIFGKQTNKLQWL